MKIYKTLVSFTDANLGKIMKCDTIQIGDKTWLVPEWKDNTATGKSKPTRMILLDSLPHRKISDPSGPADFVLNVPIPRCVFDGVIPQGTTLQFQIAEGQDIVFDIQTIS